MESLNSLKVPQIKLEMIKLPVGVTLQHPLFLECCSLCSCDVIPLGGQNGVWMSEGWQARDEELLESSEQPVLAGKPSIAIHSTVSGHANHSFLWSALEKLGLPSDAYQTQIQVRSSGLSQQGWVAKKSHVLPLVLSYFLLSGSLCKSFKDTNQFLSPSLPLSLSYIHTTTTTKDRVKGKLYCLVSCGLFRMRGCSGTNYNW